MPSIRCSLPISLLWLACVHQLPTAVATELAAPPTAESLLQGVIDQENKIHDFPKMRIRVEGKGRLSQRASTEQQQARENKRPHLDPQPEWTIRMELLFDTRRVRYRLDDHSSTDLKTWDGEIQKRHSRSGATIGSTFEGLDLRYAFDWLKVGSHSFWWFRKDPQPKLRPDGFELIGEEMYSGELCYRLDCPSQLLRLFVNKSDGRLRGYIRYFVRNPTEELALKSRVAKSKFATEREAATWIAKLSAADRDRFQRDCEQERYRMDLPYNEWTYSDYREYAPDLWMPRCVSFRLYLGNGKDDPYVSRDCALVEVSISPDLTDQDFDLTIPEGTAVTDCRHEPPLEYKQKERFTPKEWNAILEAQKERATAIQRDHAANLLRVGKRPPRLPSGDWFNSTRLQWDELRGKVVILEFFAEYCGPCHWDAEQLCELYDEGPETGICVVGIHLAGSDRDDIQAFIDELSIGYPIAVDTSESNEELGSFSRWFGVMDSGIPYTVVIDREGKVAAAGDLQDVLAIARALAEKLN